MPTYLFSMLDGLFPIHHVFITKAGREADTSYSHWSSRGRCSHYARTDRGTNHYCDYWKTRQLLGNEPKKYQFLTLIIQIGVKNVKQFPIFFWRMLLRLLYIVRVLQIVSFLLQFLLCHIS